MAPTSRRALRALALTAVLLAVPSAASATTTVTVTGDDGAPRVIDPAAPPTMRTMKPDVGVSFTEGIGRYKLAITDGIGASAGVGVDCLGKPAARGSRVDYHGNGPYVITVVSYSEADTSCMVPQTTEQVGFYVAASTVIPPATGPVLLREPDSFDLNPITLNIGLNPGADDYDVQYARNGVVGPDGGLTGTPERAFVNPITGITRLGITRSGVYTVVARAKLFGTQGDVPAPFSAPIQLVVCSPFDLAGAGRFTDANGPSYRMRWTLRDRTATGLVSIAVARGAKGGHFRSLGRSRITRGRVAKRFQLVHKGRYRLRLTYKGSQTVAAGGAVDGIRVVRTFTSSKG